MLDDLFMYKLSLLMIDDILYDSNVCSQLANDKKKSQKDLENL